MHSNESQAQREQWLIDYLYAELDSEQKKQFERAMANDAQLKTLYQLHTALDSILPKGHQPRIEDERMQGVRWAAFRNIRQQARPSLWQRFTVAWQKVSVPVQMASMAAIFFAGLLFGSIDQMPGTILQDTLRKTLADKKSALEFVGNDDYQITEMNVDSYDASKGEVQFSFALASQSQVKGNMQNPRIRQLLAAFLQRGGADDVRLHLTEILGDYASEREVKNALIYTLLNDPNPGVRYQAVEHLVSMAEQRDVRQALQMALINDVNNGIRVEAFLALTANIDAQLVEILKTHSINDANTLIRERTKRILESENDINTAPNTETVKNTIVI